MNLFPKEADLESGFGQDAFGRADAGGKLSNLVENVEQPLVIALDGAWGTGKTFFLKRWAMGHEGSLTTVYFDAFANDFHDSQLLALMVEVENKIGGARSSGPWKKLRALAPKLARPAARIGLNVASAGLAGEVGELALAGLDAAKREGESAIDALWRKERDLLESVGNFREQLTTFVEAKKKADTPGAGLVIVVDELDRCRPDHALSLLEIMKHLFAVPGVHFILGVNAKALESSVRARYGSDFDAAHYLHRFINLTMHLPDRVESSPRSVVESYFMHAGNDMGIAEDFLQGARIALMHISRPELLSFRSVQRLLSIMALAQVSPKFESFKGNRMYTLAALACLRALGEDLYDQLRNGDADVAVLKAFFGIKEATVSFSGEAHDRSILHANLAIMSGAKSEFSGSMTSDVDNVFNALSSYESKRLLHSLIGVLEDFEIPPAAAPS